MQLLLSVLHPAALGETAMTLQAGTLTEYAPQGSLIPCVKHQKSIIRGAQGISNRSCPRELTRGHTEHGNPGQHTEKGSAKCPGSSEEASITFGMGGRAAFEHRGPCVGSCIIKNISEGQVFQVIRQNNKSK